MVLAMHDGTYLPNFNFYEIAKPGQPQPKQLFLDTSNRLSAWMASHAGYLYAFTLDRNSGQMSLHQVVRDVKAPVSTDETGWGISFEMQNCHCKRAPPPFRIMKQACRFPEGVIFSLHGAHA